MCFVCLLVCFSIVNSTFVAIQIIEISKTRNCIILNITSPSHQNHTIIIPSSHQPHCLNITTSTTSPKHHIINNTTPSCKQHNITMKNHTPLIPSSHQPHQPQHIPIPPHPFHRQRSPTNRRVPLPPGLPIPRGSGGRVLGGTGVFGQFGRRSEGTGKLVF